MTTHLLYLPMLGLPNSPSPPPPVGTSRRRVVCGPAPRGRCESIGSIHSLYGVFPLLFWFSTSRVRARMGPPFTRICRWPLRIEAVRNSHDAGPETSPQPEAHSFSRCPPKISKNSQIETVDKYSGPRPSRLSDQEVPPPLQSTLRLLTTYTPIISACHRRNGKQ